MPSETSRHRHQVLPYTQGCGLDLGAGGDPVVPWAISVDLPAEKASEYGTTDFGQWPIHLRGNAFHGLHWFRDECLDWVFSSHLLEDCPREQWPNVLLEWGRVIRPGGHLMLLLPERERWQAALAAGHPPNDAHRHEPRVGELAQLFAQFGEGWRVLEDRHAGVAPDYSLLFVARKNA